MSQVGRRDPKDAPTRLRLEIGLGLNQRVQVLQQFMQRCAQGLGAGGEHHAMGMADDQVVAEETPEARQLSGKRRLADTKPPAGGSDAAFGKQDIKRDQKTQIGALKIHYNYLKHNDYRFCLSSISVHKSSGRTSTARTETMTFTKTLVTLASLVAATSLAPVTANAGEIVLKAPLQGRTLQDNGLDMSVYFTKTGANGYDVVALYVTKESPADPQRLRMRLMEGESASFSLPGHMDKFFKFARTGTGVSVTSGPAPTPAAM